ASGGTGPMVLLDQGDLRIVVEQGGDSRGMALNVDETNMIVTPVLMVDLGTFSYGEGGAQSLSNGSYSFALQLQGEEVLEILPTSGTLTGTQVFEMTSG